MKRLEYLMASKAAGCCCTASPQACGTLRACLGASLPAAEIAGAARQKRAKAIALSLVYPEDDANLPGELTLLREALPEDTTLIVGGRAMRAYREVLARLGVMLIENLEGLGKALDHLRRPSRDTSR